MNSVICFHLVRVSLIPSHNNMLITEELFAEIMASGSSIDMIKMGFIVNNKVEVNK